MYRLGGAQADRGDGAGHADDSAPSQKVFGPGNAYVVAAKRLLFGHVAVDLLPGPSEVLVLADDSADPRFIAADLLAQAEHGSGHERVWLVTPSAKLLAAVERAVAAQLPKLARREFIERALRANGWLIQVPSLADGVALVNRLAPEHCEVMTRRAARVAEDIVTAGALFLGPFSPTVLGDYVARPQPHAADGRRGRVVRGLDRGPVSTPHQRRGIHPRVAQEVGVHRAEVCRDGRAGRARTLRRNPFCRERRDERLNLVEVLKR